MDNDIEEEEIAKNPHHNRERNIVNNLIPSSFHIINGTNPLTPPEVIPKRAEECNDANNTKYPLILIIERIRE